MTLEEANNFYLKLLNLIAGAFKAGDVSIIECKDIKTGEYYKIIALVQLNEINRKIEFYPIAQLYDSNPMERIEMVKGGAVLASQIPMSKWIEKSNEKSYDISQMN